MSKKNKLHAIMAFFALFGIVIGIVGTGLLFIFGGNSNSSEQTLTQEQYLELQEYLNSQSGAIETSSGETETLTGETE